MSITLQSAKYSLQLHSVPKLYCRAISLKRFPRKLDRADHSQGQSPEPFHIAGTKPLAEPASPKRFSKITEYFVPRICYWLGFYGKSNVRGHVTRILYANCAVRATRDTDPYIQDFLFKDCGLPMNFQTWYSITQLHVWMLIVRMRDLPRRDGNKYKQLLVDYWYEDIKYRLQGEYNIKSGKIVMDTLKDLYSQFRGATVAYDEGLCKDDCILAAALWRNLFSHSTEINVEAISAMVKYVRQNLYNFEMLTDHEVLHGDIYFIAPSRFTVDLNSPEYKRIFTPEFIEKTHFPHPFISQRPLIYPGTRREIDVCKVVPQYIKEKKKVD